MQRDEVTLLADMPYVSYRIMPYRITYHTHLQHIHTMHASHQILQHTIPQRVPVIGEPDHTYATIAVIQPPGM